MNIPPTKARKQRTKSPGIALSFAARFFAIGIPYWLVPYSQLSLPNAVMGPGLAVIFLLALFQRMYAVAPFWKVTWALGGSVALVIIARVIVDAMRVPIFHSRWAFEVIIALLTGCACSATGAIAGSLLAKLLPNRPGGHDS